MKKAVVVLVVAVLLAVVCEANAGLFGRAPEDDALSAQSDMTTLTTTTCPNVVGIWSGPYSEIDYELVNVNGVLQYKVLYYSGTKRWTPLVGQFDS